MYKISVLLHTLYVKIGWQNSKASTILNWLDWFFFLQEYQDPIQPAPEEEEVLRDNRRLPPIKEFQRDYKIGKASTRLR